MGTPGVSVIPKEDKNDRMASLLQKYDGKIKAKPYRYQDLIDFLDQNYDYIETSMSAWESENFQRSYEAELRILQEEPEAKFNAASFLMIRNERNEELWRAEPSEEEIKLFIEKNTGFLSVNSILLHAQLFLVRGVTQEDIDKVTKRYQDYLIYLDAQEDHFQSLIPPLV